MDSHSDSDSDSLLKNQNQNQNNQLFLSIASIALLFLLIRLGPFSFFLLIFVAALLSALPEFRAIIDAATGIEPNSNQRLLLLLPNLSFNNQSLQNLNKPILLPDNLDITLLPPQLYASFSPIFDLIIRDFVANWYLLPAISTGDKAFLKHTRAALDHVLLKAYQKISSKSSKETMVYLIGCLSMNLVRRINERSLPNPPSPQLILAQRKALTQSISREILLTLGPPSVTLSPLTLSLLIEIVTVQIIGFSDSFDDHWFCQSIISALGTAPQVSPEAAHEIEQSVEQVALQDLPNHQLLPTPIQDPQNLPNSALPQSFPSPDPSANQILSHYLKNLPSLDRPAQAQSAPQPLLFPHITTWTPAHPSSDLQLDTLLAQPSPEADLEHASLVKIAIQLNSFRKIAQTAGLESEMLKSDAIALLSALATPMAVTMDAIQAREQDLDTRNYLASGWRSVVVEVLRRLEADQLVGEDVFANLLDWIVERLRQTEPATMLAHHSPTEPAPAPGQFDRISYMTIPTIPSSRSPNHVSLLPQAHTPHDHSSGDPWEHSMARSNSGPGAPSATESHDLGSIGTEARWSKPTSAATDAVLARHRTPSLTGRASVSPAASDWGTSPRHSLGSEPHTFSSPQPMSRVQSRRIPYEVPEEGDMAEGYSLEETDSAWSGDMGASMLEQAPAGRRSVSSISSPDDHQVSQGRTPRAFDPPLPSGPSKPLFSVTLTDMSPRTISDPKTGLLKQKKDLELLVAVECSQQDVPSFIVTRKWHEFEKLDSELSKLKLAGLGTPQFPRALLPSGFLGVKNVEQVLREGEGYLMNLLNEERYAKSGPVSKFFAKERSGMSHSRSNTIGTMLLGSTTSTLDVIGKGVASVGKEVVSKPADLAAGFNRFSKGVFAGLPFGSGSSTPTAPVAGAREEVTAEEKAPVQESRRMVPRDRASTLPSAPVPVPVPVVVPETPVQNAPETRKDSDVLMQSRGEGEGEGEAGGGVEEAGPRVSPPRAQTEPAPAPVAAAAQTPVRPARVTKATGPMTARSPDSENVTGRPAKLSKAAPATPAVGGAGLTGAEFDAVIVGLMAVLEAAYGLESSGSGSSGSAWSVKRGVLRVIETVLRTTSVGGAVRKGVGEWAMKMENVETYVEQVDGIREMLWPGGKWIGDVDGGNVSGNGNGNGSGSGSEEEKEKKESQDEKDKKQSEEENNNHQKENERKEEEEMARKLFVESWASLKVGLGSHDTEVASNKVFETLMSGGCKEIVNGLVLDLIRIVLLL